MHHRRDRPCRLHDRQPAGPAARCFDCLQYRRLLADRHAGAAVPGQQDRILRRPSVDRPADLHPDGRRHGGVGRGAGRCRGSHRHPSGVDGAGPERHFGGLRQHRLCRQFPALPAVEPGGAGGPHLVDGRPLRVARHPGLQPDQRQHLLHLRHLLQLGARPPRQARYSPPKRNWQPRSARPRTCCTASCRPISRRGSRPGRASPTAIRT